MTDKTADRRWILGWGAVLTAVGIGLPFAFHGMFGSPAKEFVYAGGVAPPIVALIAHTLPRQQNRRLAAENAENVKHLRLDAAMRAGELFAANGAQPVDP